MNDWVNRTTRQHVSHRSPGKMLIAFPADAPFVDGSGNAESNAAWIFNPDLSAVAGQPTKYWIVTGDVVTLMGAGARATVDAAELDAARDEQTARQLDQFESVMRAFMLIVLDEINVLREKHNSGPQALAPRTVAQLRNAIRNRLGS